MKTDENTQNSGSNSPQKVAQERKSTKAFIASNYSLNTKLVVQHGQPNNYL